jgi:hypothetical protein
VKLIPNLPIGVITNPQLCWLLLAVMLPSPHYGHYYYAGYHQRLSPYHYAIPLYLVFFDR